MGDVEVCRTCARAQYVSSIPHPSLSKKIRFTLDLHLRTVSTFRILCLSVFTDGSIGVMKEGSVDRLQICPKNRAGDGWIIAELAKNEILTRLDAKYNDDGKKGSQT